MLGGLEGTDLAALVKLKKRCIGRILEVKDDVCDGLDDEDSETLRQSVIVEVNHLFDVLSVYLEHGVVVNQLFLDRMEEIHSAVVGGR